MIQFGDQGPSVVAYQELLQKAGFYQNQPLDGICGQVRVAAIKNFQQKNGLAADGVLGPATESALRGQPLPSTGRLPGLIRVPTGPAQLKSFDVSSYQPGHDFTKAAAAGFQIVEIKASEGVNIRDQYFKEHWAAAAQAGLTRAPYHFYRPGSDPIAQAECFCQVIGDLSPGDMSACLDGETMDGASVASVKAGYKAFLQRVQDNTGVVPTIYGGPYFLQALLLDEDFEKYPLWVAEYGPSAPVIPPPWTSWALWQYSDRGPVPGVGNCDVSWFNGGQAQLKALTK